MKVKLFGLVIVASLVATGASFGGGSLLIDKHLATGTMAPTAIHAKAGAMVFEKYTVKPGGSFPWHTHSAPAAVVVAKGTLTVLDPTVKKCAPYEVQAGTAFVEPPNHVHTARNDGKSTVVVYVTYLGVPKGASAVVPASAPARCNG